MEILPFQRKNFRFFLQEQKQSKQLKTEECESMRNIESEMKCNERKRN